MESKPPIINVIPNRKRTKVIQAVIVVAVVFVGYKAYRGVFGASGTAANVGELKRVYLDAGSSYAAFYTNTFLQQMPFTQRIAWHRRSVRPSVTLTSRVDVAEFKRKMATEPFTTIWDKTSQGEFEAWFVIHHRVGDWVMYTSGTLDLVSGGITMQSTELERMLDDAEWRHETNGGYIQFDFKGTNGP